MKDAANLFFAVILLSTAVIWQAGCNPDLGVQDPLRPRADMQVLSFSPAVLNPTQVNTGGVETVRSADGLTVSTRPIITTVFPQPRVTVRINNGVSAVITGYSVTYTFANSGAPATGLPVYGGSLTVFVDAGTVGSFSGGAEGNGPIAVEIPDARTEDTIATGNGTGRSEFVLDVVSIDARELLIVEGTAQNPTIIQNPNPINANITFFVQDINGNNFTVRSQVQVNSIILPTGAGT